MAIEADPAALGCDGQDGGSPVAFGRWQRIESPRTSTFGPWELLCFHCVRGHSDDPDYQLIYLDPTGQRRPPPDHDPPEDDDHDPTDVGYWIDGRRP